MTKAQITVYLQALDGHFLGPRAYETNKISIKFHYSGREVDLPYKLASDSDDGSPTKDFVTGKSTFMPIITVPGANKPTQVNFLTSDNQSIAGTHVFDLPNQIERAELDISVPLTYGDPFRIRQQVILHPAQTIYKIIIVVPGLYLAESKIPGMVSVYVRMMCGCPVSPTTLWPDGDFIVFADVLDTFGGTNTYKLEYDKNQPVTSNSLFSYKLSGSQKPIRTVTFRANQISAPNYGVLVQVYLV
jgi:hypothetical protein